MGIEAPLPIIDIIVHNPQQVDIIYRDPHGNMIHEFSIYAISGLAAYVYVRGLIAIKNAALYKSALPSYQYLKELFNMDERRN